MTKTEEYVVTHAFEGSEKCDLLDNDCDGNIDEEFTTLMSTCSVE